MKKMIASAALSIGLVLGLAAPAFAHHGIMDADVTCSLKGYEVIWSLENSESDKEAEVTAASVNVGTLNGITLGAGLGRNANHSGNADSPSILGRTSVPRNTVGPVTLSVTITWQNQVTWSGSYSVTPSNLSCNIKGDTGATGPQGPAGPAGTNGTNGSKGDTGSAGTNGSKGDTGSAGTNGSKGDTGSAGPQGPAGAPGNNGTDGKNGVDGTDGTNGTDGKNGANGADAAGSPGLNGVDGAKGTNGASGKDGVNGTNGVDGKDGQVVYYYGCSDGSVVGLGASCPAGEKAVTPPVAVLGSQEVPHTIDELPHTGTGSSHLAEIGVFGGLLGLLMLAGGALLKRRNADAA